MAITFTPSVGDILVCNYGDYARDPNGALISNHFDGHLQPEMVKNRLVVVLNGKINSNACIVVPLSTTQDHDKIRRGMHVEIPEDTIEDLHYFDAQLRWAKADLVQQVSRNRLFLPRLATRGHLNRGLPRDMMTLIQRAVIKAINASSLLAPEPETVPKEAGS